MVVSRKVAALGLSDSENATLKFRMSVGSTVLMHRHVALR